MNRKPITNILGLSLRIIEPISGRSEVETQAVANNSLCLVRNDNPTKVVAVIAYDDLFDGDGNRFYDNRCHPSI